MVGPALNDALSVGNVAALPLAFMGGVVAGANPCCVALYPAVAGCCTATEQPQKQSLGNAIAFSLGMALSVALLGLAAVSLGRVTLISAPIRYAIAFVPILMGLWRLGWIRLRLPDMAMRPSIGGAFGTGLLISLVVGPCGTPLLASVLSFAVYKQSFAYGGLLLFLYGIGTSLPLAVAGTAVGTILGRLESGRFATWVDRTVGALLVLLGLYLLWRI